MYRIRIQLGENQPVNPCYKTTKEKKEINGYHIRNKYKAYGYILDLIYMNLYPM